MDRDWLESELAADRSIEAIANGGSRSVDRRVLGQQARADVVSCAEARGAGRHRGGSPACARRTRPLRPADRRRMRPQRHGGPALADPVRAEDTAGPLRTAGRTSATSAARAAIAADRAALLSLPTGGGR